MLTTTGKVLNMIYYSSRIPELHDEKAMTKLPQVLVLRQMCPSFQAYKLDTETKHTLCTH